MIIMKFGGSSVKNAERINQVKSIVEERLSKKPILVFSAMGDTTDFLLKAGNDALNGNFSIQHIVDHHLEVAKELQIDSNCYGNLFSELTELLNGIKLIKEISPKSSDYLVSFGERLSVRAISAFFSKSGIPAKSYDAWEIGLKTTSNFQDAYPLNETFSNINNFFKDLKNNYTYTPIVTGFIGKDINGSITTFGRGGSDLTCSILGASVQADEIQVWKDVDGLMTSDPRIVSNAKPVNYVTFDEAAELSYFGAKVLHPLSMQPAKEYDIPVRVKNSYSPDSKGTLISKEKNYSQGPIKSISLKKNITLVDIYSNRMLGASGFLAKIFTVFDRYEIPIDLLASSEVSISFTLSSDKNLEKAKKEIENFADINIFNKNSIVSLICDVTNSSTVLNCAFKRLSEANLHPKVLSQGASKSNIGMVFEENDAVEALKVLHNGVLELYKET